MTRKHNTKHPDRGWSNYKHRLAKRGLTNTQVRMEPLEVLRRRQERRIEETGVPWVTSRGYAATSGDRLLAA